MNLNVNDAGPPVLACQNALKSVLSAESKNALNGVYGAGTADDVALFRAKRGLAVVADGLILDGATINLLEGFMNAANLAWMKKPLTSDVRHDAILFNVGDAGPPIAAAQNALVRALESEGTEGVNARNGSYGARTCADLAELGERKHLPIAADGRAINAITWQLLLRYMDAAGRANAGKALEDDVPALQTMFQSGDEGPPVEALQAALHTVLGKSARNLGNGAYGARTAEDLVRARLRANLTPVGTGETCDKVTWDWLYSFMTQASRKKAAKPLTKDVGLGTAPPGSDLGAAIAHSALEAHERLRRIWVYHQYRPMASSLWSEFARGHSDCSSFATLCFKDAGAPDPNRRGYDGYGFTGSLWPRGTDCPPKAGALAFYGGSKGTDRNDTTHVAVCVNESEVISFGSTPISRRNVHYRSDFRGCREFAS